ncbi:16179_t:CDS:2, partial [Dentiscutata heterogama]
ENPFSVLPELKPYANAFPDSKFQIIIKNKNLTFGEKKEDKKQFFFKELLDDYISDKFFIINYGSTLMETFLFLKEDESTSDIQLLSIIIEFFPQLLRRHPIYLARFLSQTAFVMPLADPDMILDSEIVSLLPTQHLYHFGTYNQLSTKTSLIDTFVSNITFYWNKLIHRSKQEMDISQPSVNLNKAIPDSEATIKLIIPLPKFVNYPKSYSTWQEIKNPSPSYFTNSIDLELYKYWNDEPSYSSDPNDPWNLATTYDSVSEDGVISTQPSLIEPPDASTNMFSMFATSILAVYLMLTAHVSELRDLIREIESGDWQGFEKPFFSQILLKAVQAEELETSDEKASIEELKNEIKDLKEKIMKFINTNGGS